MYYLLLLLTAFLKIKVSVELRASGKEEVQACATGKDNAKVKKKLAMILQ